MDQTLLLSTSLFPAVSVNIRTYIYLADILSTYCVPSSVLFSKTEQRDYRFWSQAGLDLNLRSTLY